MVTDLERGIEAWRFEGVVRVRVAGEVDEDEDEETKAARRVRGVARWVVGARPRRRVRESILCRSMRRGDGLVREERSIVGTENKKRTEVLLSGPSGVEIQRVRASTSGIKSYFFRCAAWQQPFSDLRYRYHQGSTFSTSAINPCVFAGS